MRRHRLALASCAVALVLVGGGAALVGLFSSTMRTVPAGGPSPAGVAGSSGTAAASPTATTPTTAPPAAAPAVPGTHGDGYVRNVDAGATCSPAGALGFTVDMKPVQCATTATDPQLRWRTL